MHDVCDGRGDVHPVAFTAVRTPIYSFFSLQMSYLDVLDYSCGGRATIFFPGRSCGKIDGLWLGHSPVLLLS